MEKKILSFNEAKQNIEMNEEADDINDMILALIDAAFDESCISDEMSPEEMYKLASNAYADEYKRKNICHILAYMKKSAKSGYIPAMLFLGEYHNSTKDSVEPDYHESFKWYKMAADKGVEEGEYQTAKLYENGKGVKRDLKIAFELYKRAADKERAEAINALGRFYMHGIVVERDEDKAYSLFEKSVDMGCVDALYNLSVCYLEGIGVDADFLKARALKTKADKLKHQK